MQSAYTISSAQRVIANQSGALSRSLNQQLQQLGSAIAQFFTPEAGITVRKGQRQGQPIWFVYDRYTNQSHEFTSEEAVRVWLRA